MTPTYPAFVRNWLFRMPAWRWGRAQALVSAGRYVSRNRDDDETRRAVHHLRRCGPDGSTAAASRLDPALAAAHALHLRGDQVPLVVQARLLARQTDGTIALLTGVPADVIAVYESTFFNVRPYLDARDWVSTQAVHGGAGAVTGDLAVRGAILKRFAYGAGPVMLDAVLPYLLGGQDPFAPSPDLSTPEGRQDQKVRLLVALELLPETPETAPMTAKIALILRELERKRAVRAPRADLIGENVEALLVKLPAGAVLRHETAPQQAVHDTAQTARRKAA